MVRGLRQGTSMTWAKRSHVTHAVWVALFAALATTQAGPARADQDYACLMEPRQTLKLAASVQGLVASVDVDRGDMVKRGQVIARLEADIEEANVGLAAAKAVNDSPVRQARARVEFLRRK